MSENELQSCPHCGSKPMIVTGGFIQCTCDNHKVKDWNTRHLPPEVEAVIDAAREFEIKNRDLQQGLCLYKDFRASEIAVRDTIRAYDKSRGK